MKFGQLSRLFLPNGRQQILKLRSAFAAAISNPCSFPHGSHPFMPHLIGNLKRAFHALVHLPEIFFFTTLSVSWGKPAPNSVLFCVSHGFHAGYCGSVALERQDLAFRKVCVWAGLLWVLLLVLLERSFGRSGLRSLFLERAWSTDSIVPYGSWGTVQQSLAPAFLEALPRPPAHS